MKKLEIVIRPEQLDDLKEILNENNANGLMITSIMGYGSQMGVKKVYRGVTYNATLLPKMKVETVIADEVVDGVIDKVIDRIRTGIRNMTQRALQVCFP